VSLRQSLNRSKTFISLHDGVANDYLTVTTNDIRQNSREISELNSKMNTLATKEDLKKVMDMLTKNIRINIVLENNSKNN